MLARLLAVVEAAGVALLLLLLPPLRRVSSPKSWVAALDSVYSSTDSNTGLSKQMEELRQLEQLRQY
jgi:hypothetical protein